MSDDSPPKREQRFTLSGRARSFAYALRGIGVMLRTQHNARLHAVATILVVIGGALLGLDAQQWCWVTIAVVAVWVAEALNTAFELLCDVASPEFHPLVRQAKDVAAAAVLITSVGAVIVGLLVVGPVILERLN